MGILQVAEQKGRIVFGLESGQGRFGWVLMMDEIKKTARLDELEKIKTEVVEKIKGINRVILAIPETEQLLKYWVGRLEAYQSVLNLVNWRREKLEGN